MLGAGTVVAAGRSALSGNVSGIIAQKPINPAAAIPAKNRNAALEPASTTMKPATAELRAPPPAQGLLPQSRFGRSDRLTPSLPPSNFPANFWGE
jgi:hypothetical protein